MEDGYYLSQGYLLGGHYEIVKVLGEDEFEILYLVKDIHRLETLFVIKELFLKAYARRENETVQVMAKSKLLFEDTKREMIEEITKAKNQAHESSVQIYGYLEENNTIYTIMAFINNSNLEHYLQNNPLKEKKKEEIILTPIEPVITQKTPKQKETSKEEKFSTKDKQKPKSYVFIKILSISVLIMAALAYYSWNMIKKDKERAKSHKVSVVTERTVHTPSLDNRDEASKKSEKKEDSIKTEESTQEVKNERPFNASYIEEGEQESEVKDELTNVPNEEKKVKELTESIPTVKQENPNTLGTQIGGVNRTKRFNRNTVKKFLDQFLASSTTGSIDDIVAQYDSKVDRYFSLKNVNHSEIRQDKVNYQKKWTNRDFRLVSFKIVSMYRKGNFDYCDLATTIQWNVSSASFKTSAGRSKGFMTLKRTYDGFKVTSIYTVK